MSEFLRTNEKYLFEFEDFSTEVFDDDRNYFFSGKVLNGKWFKANTQNLDIGTEALQLYNQAIYSSYDPNNQLNYESLNTNTLDLYLYDALNFALNSKHGIINHNRKFYYDKISETFIPIYYDGMSNILNGSKVTYQDLLYGGSSFSEGEIIGASYAITSIQNLDKKQ